MDKLPTELMSSILEELDPSDLKRVRLASKVFYDVSTDLLFKRAYASIHRPDLDVLSAMANHPAIRLAVREIVYAGAYFHYPEIETNECRMYHYRHFVGEQLFNVQQRVGRRIYRAHLREQEETRKSGEDLAIISTALAMMPNVRKVTLTNYFDGSPFRKRYYRVAVEPCGIPLRVGEGVHADEQFDHGFKVMCKAMSISGRQVEEFLTDYRRNEPIYHGMVPASFVCSSRELEHYRNAFRHLRKIHLRIDQSGPKGSYSVIRTGQLATFLAEATGLEELSICTDRDVKGVPLPRLGLGLSTHKWEHLRCLTLQDMRIPFEEFSAFAQLQREQMPSLEKLNLTSIRLLKGEWTAAAHKLNEFKGPALTSVSCLYLSEKPFPSRYVGDGVVERLILGLDLDDFHIPSPEELDEYDTEESDFSYEASEYSSDE
ncbi:Anaphase-promoting complex subunit 8 [Hypoxylon texense]